MSGAWQFLRTMGSLWSFSLFLSHGIALSTVVLHPFTSLFALLGFVFSVASGRVRFPAVLFRLPSVLFQPDFFFTLTLWTPATWYASYHQAPLPQVLRICWSLKLGVPFSFSYQLSECFFLWCVSLLPGSEFPLISAWLRVNPEFWISATRRNADFSDAVDQAELGSSSVHRTLFIGSVFVVTSGPSQVCLSPFWLCRLQGASYLVVYFFFSNVPKDPWLVLRL